MSRLLLGLCLSVVSLFVEAADFTEHELKQIASLSGELIKSPRDVSNRVSGNPDAIALGQQLFFDQRLSADGKVSCGSCHQPDQGFADGVALSDLRGETLKRHTPGLWNVALNRWYFWDGRADSLWSQALHSLEAESEMRSNRVYLAHLVLSDRALRDSYTRLFGPVPECLSSERLPESGQPSATDAAQQANWAGLSDCQRHGVNQLFTGVAKLLAAYQETLLARNSRFDRFAAEMTKHNYSDHLSAQEQQGLKLFIGKARCVSCHSGPNFSDSEFHSVFFNDRNEPGRYAAIPTLLADPFNQKGVYSDRNQSQPDKLDYVYRSVELRRKFKTPGLRNLGATAPYMHDGSMRDLSEVLNYYAGLAGTIEKERHEETVLNGLVLDHQEIEALQAFLLTLNDEPPEVLQ